MGGEWQTLAPLVVAPFVGSFLGLLASRMPKGEGVMLGRSRCPACGTALGAGDLVPLVSYAVLRGRCRYCAAPIDPLCPLMELAALGVAAWAVLVLPPALVWWGCLLAWSLLPLAVIDWLCLRLPDGLTLFLGGGGMVFTVAVVPGRSLDHGIGAAAGLALCWLVAFAYRRCRGREGLGLGDAKLMAAAGAWVGWQGLGSCLLIGAVIALVGILVAAGLGRRIAADQALPFGSALCLGLWLTWAHGPLLFG